MKELTTGEALKILRKKRPELSILTIKQWVRDGKMKGRKEKHGIFKIFLIPENEVNRVLGLLPAGKRVIGRPLLPDLPRQKK